MNPQDPSKLAVVQPGDWFQFDHVYFDHYVKLPLPDSNWKLIRPGGLVAFDRRTLNPLGFLPLMGDRDCEQLGRLLLQVLEAHGLPRCGLCFDNTLLDWLQRQDWRETIRRFEGLGLKFYHRSLRGIVPTEPRLERILHDLEQRVSCRCDQVESDGRDARSIALINRARKGDPEALKAFLPIDSWLDCISTGLAEFSHVVDLVSSDGHSPNATWAGYNAQHPLRRMPEDANYLLAPYRRQIVIMSHGIVLTIRNRRRIFWDEQTALLIGKKVWAYFDPEIPGRLIIQESGQHETLEIAEIVFRHLLQPGQQEIGAG